MVSSPSLLPRLRISVSDLPLPWVDLRGAHGLDTRALGITSLSIRFSFLNASFDFCFESAAGVTCRFSTENSDLRFLSLAVVSRVSVKSTMRKRFQCLKYHHLSAEALNRISSYNGSCETEGIVDG
ncbi:hypothetical protein R1flu_011413 [Riccia fluitans]|uniref:Uncharacterized protein n=1 Tax=Riccia fluitans TaxID=41844 RepID=A0ABD1Z7S1_9MARC